MKMYTIIGPLGDADIQAATPQPAASLYPMAKGYKSSIAQEYVVTCDETKKRFKVAAFPRYEAVEID
jgi:hypothetical protein